jgi:hypothetical protein
VLNAVRASEELHRRQLHEYELPVALMMLQTAEMNRDRKKNKKPFTLESFCFYKDPEETNSPAARYGAAAVALLDMGLFPAWALFVYKDLKTNAENAMPPEPLALVGDFVVILAPSVDEGQCTGMLIASMEASDKVVEVFSPCGKSLTVRVPKFEGSVFALEDASLPIK